METLIEAADASDVSDEQTDEEIDESKLVEQIRAFLKYRNNYFEDDVTEFKRARNLAAGMGWFKRLGKAFGESRANITINPLANHIDSTISAFVREPFKFVGLPEEEESKINHVLADCLREACELGLSYFYIYHEEDGKLRYKHISALDCIYTKEECVVFKREKRKEREPASGVVWAGVTSLDIGAEQKVILTHFKKNDKGVSISKFDGSTLAGHTELPLSALPIIPICAKKVFLTDNEPHWRGYYFKLADIVAAINLNLSVAAERVFTKTPMVAPVESFMNDNGQYIKDWESNEPRNLYLYSAKYPVEDQTGFTTYLDLPAPIQAASAVDLDKLNNQLQVYTGIVNSELGTQLADENRGTETAMAVLQRSRAKEDARSEILYNLNRSAKKIAKLLEEYIEVLTGQPVGAPIEVTDQLSHSLKLQQSIEMMVTTQQMPPNERLALLTQFNADPEIIQAVQQTVQNSQDPEKQQLQQQLGQLQQTIQAMQNENKVAEVMYKNKLIEAQNERDIKMAELELEREKLKLEWAKLGQKADADGVKLGIDQAKAQAEIAGSQSV